MTLCFDLKYRARDATFFDRCPKARIPTYLVAFAAITVLGIALMHYMPSIHLLSQHTFQVSNNALLHITFFSTLLLGGTGLLIRKWPKEPSPIILPENNPLTYTD